MSLLRERLTELLRGKKLSRAGNPNVKKVYEKYHDVGLEILNVSLDNKKERWIEAIKQAGLPWIHL